MRNISLSEGEHYHIFNRGVDKKNIFVDQNDFNRFLIGLKLFNTREIVGNLSRQHEIENKNKLVDFTAYSISSNHFHFILKPICEKGIEMFMHKLSMGYAKYFNAKHKRSGALFQGKFKAILVDTNEYLLHLSAYINLNNHAHARGHSVSTFEKSSFNEYSGKKSSTDLCKTNIILEQFDSPAKYKEFAEEALANIIERKNLLDDLKGEEIVWTPSVNMGGKK
ncbi:hypothetical protein BH11PAT3_BH11PAT3_2170 [soil metagenome]